MKLRYFVLAGITCLTIILVNTAVTAQTQQIHDGGAIVGPAGSRIISESAGDGVSTGSHEDGLPWWKLKLGVKNGGLSHPLPGYNSISSGFGKRIHPVTGYQSNHYGIDFPAPKGTPVVAAASGTVVDRGWMGGAGNAILLEHASLGQQTFYAHLSKIAVNTGEWVERGSAIGYVGSTGNSTGPHLHFEVWEHNGNKWTAIDPEKRLGLPDNGRPPREPKPRIPCNPEPWAPCGPPRNARQKTGGRCSIPAGSEHRQNQELRINNQSQFRQHYPETLW